MSTVTVSASVAPPPTRHGLDRFDAATILLLLLTYVGVAALPFAPKKFGDLNFHDQAKDLAQVMRGSLSWREVNITRAPAPVFYYALPYALVPPGSDDNAYWRAGFTWTTIWMAFSVLVIRRCGEMLGGPVVGKTAAVLTLLSPFSVYYSYGILAEPPAYLGVVLMAYGLLRWRSSARPLAKSGLDIFLLSTGLLVFVLSRPNAVLLLVFAVLAGVMRLWRGGDAQKRAEGKFVLASTFTAIAVIAIVTLALMQKPGGAASNPQNQNLALVVLQGRFQFRTVLWDFRTWPNLPDNPDFIAFTELRQEFQQTSERTGIPFSKLEWQWIGNDFLQHPVTTLRASAVRLVCLHMAFVHSLEVADFHFGPLRGRFGYAVFHLAVNACTILLVLGTLMFLLDRRHQLLSYWVLWGPWMALTAFHVLTYAEARYLFPSRPGLVLMAATALVPRARVMLSSKSRIVPDAEVLPSRGLPS